MPDWGKNTNCACACNAQRLPTTFAYNTRVLSLPISAILFSFANSVRKEYKRVHKMDNRKIYVCNAALSRPTFINRLVSSHLVFIPAFYLLLEIVSTNFFVNWLSKKQFKKIIYFAQKKK